MSTSTTGTSPGNRAKRAADSDWVDTMGAVGLIVYGVVHVVLAWLAIQLALGDRRGSTSSTGAVRELAQGPVGGPVIWLVAVGLVLLVVWQAIEAAFDHRDEDGVKRTMKRLQSAGKAVLYAALAYSAVRIATSETASGGSGGGGSGSGGSSTDTMTAQLMNAPGGQVLVGLVGLAIIGVGGYRFYAAYEEKYTKKMDRDFLTGSSGTAFRWLARIGYVAKGLVLIAIGGLFLYAAATHEPKKSGGIDQALRTLLDQPFGPWIVIACGVGFAGYGVYCVARARHLQR
ncbi:MAG: hypothetical protein CMH83_22175 [Nocardioides sp.]|nr:hypothetical protein [Nocardioides sp.]